MVRSQFIKTAFTFAAGTGVGFAANAKYHGQGKASKMIKVLISQTKVVSANFNESLMLYIRNERLFQIVFSHCGRLNLSRFVVAASKSQSFWFL